MIHPMMNNPMLGPYPVTLQCNTCGAEGLTRVVKDPNNMFTIGCVVITLLGGFCLTPLLCCWTSAFDYSHHCSVCGTLLGVNKH
ncbi:unnamed protein product [Meloidogyne enterolobii]|uniref:Uncharacterized protein n=1 Tax=Meloidogyne enterolobii TaxID=390850 RepID=A0ACB1AZC9_MELEN